MGKKKIKRSAVRWVMLLFFLGAVLGLQAQSLTVYPLRLENGALLNPVSADDYDLLVDGNGGLHILWGEGGYFYYGRVVYHAASGEYRVSGKEYTQVNAIQDGVNRWFSQPRAAVRRDGKTFHIVWGDTLKHAWRDAQGVWRKETVRTISGVQKCRAPSVLVDDSETVHVLYGYYDRSNGNDPTHLIYQRKPAGAAWSGYMEFDRLGYNQGAEWRNPVMILDSKGGIHATWSNQIFYATPDGGSARYRYAPAGTGLEHATTIIVPRAEGVKMDGVGNIFVDPFGAVHRTICSSLSTIDHIKKQSGAATTWKTITRPSKGFLRTPEDSWATLTTDSCGCVLVAYADGSTSSNYPNLYLSVLQDGAWTKYTISTSAGLYSFRQPFVVSAGGTLFLMWRESSGQMHLGTAPDSCGSLDVLTPDGGETWAAGESRNITWTSAGSVGLVDIEYSTNNGATWTSIVRNTANDGLHAWTVPDVQSPHCRVRVKEVDGHPVGTSEAIFAITVVDLDVTAPNGFEYWNLGAARNITWTATGYTGTVKLALYKGGALFGDIATGLDAGAGSYSWTAGQCVGATAGAGADYRVKVSSADGAITDQSDSDFSLVSAAQLQLTSPNGGESWQKGTQRSITWNANDYDGNVRLILLDKGVKIGQIVTGIPAAQGSYLWTVGAHSNGTAPAGTQYSIRLLAGDGSQSDYSDAPFSITN